MRNVNVIQSLQHIVKQFGCRHMISSWRWIMSIFIGSFSMCADRLHSIVVMINSNGLLFVQPQTNIALGVTCFISFGTQFGQYSNWYHLSGGQHDLCDVFFWVIRRHWEWIMEKRFELRRFWHSRMIEVRFLCEILWFLAILRTVVC